MGIGLQEVYDMSWAEFVLRSIGFRQKQKREEILTREVAYQIYVGNHSFSKKSPKSKNAFWKIEDEKKGSTISEVSKQAYLKAMERYKKEKGDD